MDEALNIPDVAFHHRRLESSAYGSVALGDMNKAIPQAQLVQPAGIVLAAGAWDYQDASTKPTPLDTSMHEPTFQYRALLGNQRYTYIEHETEGQESIFGRDLYRAKVTLGQPLKMGRAVMDIVRTDWDELDIQLRQAESPQALAAAEPQRLDTSAAKDLLSEFLHLSIEDPKLSDGLHSIEDVLTMMTHQAAGAARSRSHSQETHRSAHGFTTASIEEKTTRSGRRKPVVTHKLGVLSVFHLDQDPDITMATRLDFETQQQKPRMAATVRTHLKISEGGYVAPAKREDMLREAARKYLIPAKFFETMERQFDLLLAARKRA